MYIGILDASLFARVNVHTVECMYGCAFSLRNLCMCMCVSVCVCECLCVRVSQCVFEDIHNVSRTLSRARTNTHTHTHSHVTRTHKHTQHALSQTHAHTHTHAPGGKADLPIKLPALRQGNDARRNKQKPSRHHGRAHAPPRPAVVTISQLPPPRLAVTVFRGRLRWR